VLVGILAEKDHRIETIDLSGNNLLTIHLEQILLSLTRNKTLIGLDLRNNPGYREGMCVAFAS
jgi:hypothetical protein